MQVPKYTLSTCTCPSIWLQQVKITSAITHCGIFIGIVTINAYFCIAGLGTAAGKLFSQQKNNHIKSWMDLLSGPLPANSKLLSGTLPANSKLLSGTLPANNKLLSVTLPANNKL